MLTISCGVSSWPLRDVAPEKTTWRDVLQLADDALYRAKAEGRNQVSIALPPIGTPKSSGTEELPEDKPVKLGRSACRKGRHDYGRAQHIGAGITRRICDSCGEVSIDLTGADEVTRAVSRERRIGTLSSDN